MTEEKRIENDIAEGIAEASTALLADGRRTRESARHVDAVLGALDLLDCFDNQESLSVGEFSGKTGINRSRVMRLAGTLESRDYLIFDPETRQYCLGHRLLSLGQRFSDGIDAVALSRPFLADLSKETGETASLFGIDGHHRIVLAISDGHHEVRHALAVGDRKALQAGASGKVLLAYCASALRDSLLRKALGGRDGEKRAADDLRAELAAVAEKGFATSHRERIADAAAIAAPVFLSGGRIVAAIGISGAASRFTDAFVAEALPRVRASAEALSRRLGWRGHPGDVGQKKRQEA